MSVEQERAHTTTVFFAGGPMDGKQLRVPHATEGGTVEIRYGAWIDQRMAIYRLAWRNEELVGEYQGDRGDGL
jgi:hypothetical protein